MRETGKTVCCHSKILTAAHCSPHRLGVSLEQRPDRLLQVIWNIRMMYPPLKIVVRTLQYWREKASDHHPGILPVLLCWGNSNLEKGRTLKVVVRLREGWAQSSGKQAGRG